MIISTTSKIFIAIAWGPRRATSNKRYGVSSAYPSHVSASHGLWLHWLKRGIFRWLMWDWKIVIPPSHAKDRVRKAIGHIGKPQQESHKRSAFDLDVGLLLAERESLRRQKRFTEADAIRDKLVAAGVTIKDARL